MYSKENLNALEMAKKRDHKIFITDKAIAKDALMVECKADNIKGYQDAAKYFL